MQLLGEMSHANTILLAALGITIVSALVDTVLPAPAANPGPIDLVVTILYSVCAFAWVKADARARQIEVPSGAALLAALIVPIGVPVYLFRVLGARHGLRASLKAFGFFLVLGVAYVSVFYVAEVLAPQGARGP